jgi:hypothetical protein
VGGVDAEGVTDVRWRGRLGRVISMTRPMFFAAIAAFFGVQAVAQNQKPANGTCPVCATKAEPYKKTPGTDVMCVKEVAEVGGLAIQTYPCWPVKLIRCSHCSAAFYQDAE